MFLIMPQRISDGCDQTMFIEWLLNEINGTCLHCFDGRWDIPMPRQKNYRQLNSSFMQFRLQFHTGHAWHANIQYEAATHVMTDELAENHFQI